jgi:hypothetical protein
MARTRSTKPAETEEVEEGGTGRGPTALHEAMAAWLNKEYKDEADGITPDQVRLAQTKRKEFRTTDGSGYDEALDAMEEQRETLAAEKEKRAEERAAAKAEREAAAAAKTEGADEEKPKRSRTKKAAATAEAGDEGPVETTRTKNRRRGTAAATTEAAAPAEGATPKGRRKAAF